MPDAVDPQDPARDFLIARDVVPEILDELDVEPDSTECELALRYARRYDMAVEVAGRSPQGVAAGMVYLACNITSESNPTRQEVAESADVHIQTVTDNWRIIADLEGVEYRTSAEPSAEDVQPGLIERVRQVFARR